MFSKSIVRKVTLPMAGAALVAGIFAGSGHVHAQPIHLGDGTPCTTADGKSVPEGTTGKDRWGITYVCISGKWEVSPQALTVDPGTRFPKAPVNTTRLSASQ